MANGFSYKSPLDIGNRACQILGVTRMQSFTEDSKQAAEISACYDQLRQAELRRNVWRFSTRKTALRPINNPLMPSTSPPTSGLTVTNMPTMIFVPPVWAAETVYTFGAIVQDSSGTIWKNTLSVNLDNTPGTFGSEAWDTYFGSMCVSPYDTTGTTGYYSGELVYETNAMGETQIFSCRLEGNPNAVSSVNTSVDPSMTGIWEATTLYMKGQVVTDGSYFYQSAIDLNQGNMPSVTPNWSVGVTYSTGAQVISPKGAIYASAVNSNTGHNPDTTPADWTLVSSFAGMWPLWNDGVVYNLAEVVAAVDGNLYRSLLQGNNQNDPLGLGSQYWVATGQKQAWATAFSTGAGDDLWTSQFATLVAPNIDYPLGSSVAVQSFARNIFQLPNGFAREAPQDPKAGSTSFLGAPTGLMYNDWTYEGNYFTSRQFNPIVYRFAADITNVQKMDTMFCEGLACRIALELCETLTQSEAKKGSIAALYKLQMGEARTVNGIETGPTEPPEDDYITSRI